jgi:hypothetical protein
VRRVARGDGSRRRSAAQPRRSPDATRPGTEGEWTWNLHTQTLGRTLDHFILFSSLSSVFATPARELRRGQRLPRRPRRPSASHDLPGLTVNWGYLGEVGYLAERPQLGERLDRQGVKSFTVRQALAALERAMQRQAVQISVMHRLVPLARAGRDGPRVAALAHLLETTGANPDEARGRLGSVLSAHRARRSARHAPPGQGRPHPRDVSGSTGRRRPLLNLGFDSLMAVELRNWIGGELRINLPIVELMRPSLSRLTELLLQQLAPSDKVGGEPSGSSLPTAHCSLPTFPLAHGQRGLWFPATDGSQQRCLQPLFRLRIRSTLDRAAFQQAWQALIDRHPPCGPRSGPRRRTAPARPRSLARVARRV